jgi:hypothetical protein
MVDRKTTHISSRRISHLTRYVGFDKSSETEPFFPPSSLHALGDNIEMAKILVSKPRAKFSELSDGQSGSKKAAAFLASLKA